MVEPSITFGAICSYGKLHNWYFLEWQIIPDQRVFEVCTYSLNLSWNVIRIVAVLIIIGLGIWALKRRKKSKPTQLK